MKNFLFKMWFETIFFRFFGGFNKERGEPASGGRAAPTGGAEPKKINGSKNLTNPIWWAIIDNSRTYFERKR